ncbi:MAG: hypothetical protein DRG78_12520 [Epsilonproteobacteria bacterium]|nr:MAG: hypothetical protein DRG78_12520 [Campylobacterota bacterium]
MEPVNLVNDVSGLVQVIKPDLLWTIIQSSIVIFIILIIKDYLTSAVNLMNFKGSKYVCIGTRIRIPNPTGHSDCEITDVNRKFITLENKDVRILMPLKNFREQKWTLIKPASEVQNTADLIKDQTDDNSIN